MLSIALSIRRNLLILVLACGTAAGLSGCAGTGFQSGASRPTARNAAIRTELYFGEIPENHWKRFISEEVTPRFPDGLTFVPVSGQWRGNDGRIIKEASHVLILIHDKSSVTEEKLETIRTLFAKRFQQESVMRVSWPVEVAF